MGSIKPPHSWKCSTVYLKKVPKEALSYRFQPFRLSEGPREVLTLTHFSSGAQFTDLASIRRKPGSPGVWRSACAGPAAFRWKRVFQFLVETVFPVHARGARALLPPTRWQNVTQRCPVSTHRRSMPSRLPFLLRALWQREASGTATGQGGLLKLLQPQGQSPSMVP